MGEHRPRQRTRHRVGGWQGEPQQFGLSRKKRMRDLDQNTGAVSREGIGTDRAAMFEVFENAQRVFDDAVRLSSLEVCDEPDAAGIDLARRIE